MGIHVSRQKGNAEGVFDIGPACEEAFCRVIAQRTGIVLHDHQLPNLRDTIRQGCGRFGFSGCIQFLQSLEASHGPTAELEFLIAGVTVGESYFFRDSEQIALLRDSLLPQLIAAKRDAGDLSLRIWSAGCSMGQEIYTIALLLHELIPDISSWRLHLLGTDINTGSVSSAIHGRYSEWSFRATPPALRERWFTRVGAEYDLRPEVRQMVKFSYLNLTADVFPSILGETNALDIILCRNVFIYLDREVICRIMAQFAECLNTDGVLMMGASDPVDMQCAGLEWQHDGQAAYFRKRAITAAREPAPVLPPLSLPATTLPPVGGAVADDARAFVPKPGHSAGESSVVLKMRQGDWSGVVALVDEISRQGEESSMLQQMKAQALANMGRADLAHAACLSSLRLDPVNKHTYLIQALILGELGRTRDKEEALRKALYLDHSFLEAHYELGILRIYAGRLESGIKSLENALKLAQEGNPQRPLHNASGMTYQRFAQVLQGEIEIYRNGNTAAALKLASRRKK